MNALLLAALLLVSNPSAWPEVHGPFSWADRVMNSTTIARRGGIYALRAKTQAIYTPTFDARKHFGPNLTLPPDFQPGGVAFLADFDAGSSVGRLSATLDLAFFSYVLGFKNVISVKEQQVSDGNFPTVPSPNPEEPAALKMALELADKVGADVVMGTDPDADRMGIAVRDNNGKMVLFNGNQTAAVLTYYILTRWKELGKIKGNPYIVKTIVTTPLLVDIAKSFGIECYDVLTGFKYIADIVKRNEGKRTFICGGEESFGFNVGEFVRDKDAPISCCMVAECAAWAADQGLTLYQLLEKIYKEYGYRKEGLVSVVRKGISGAEEIKKIMADYRSVPPKELAGSPVVKVIDYNQPEKTGLPASNVLQFFAESGDVVTVRPSGTEPKIKFYFGAKGNDADAKIEALKKQFA